MINPISQERAAVERFERRIVKLAQSNQHWMQGLSEREPAEFVKQLITGSTIVFGVWTDLTGPRGVDMLIIKG
jgi:hypothetical protein